MCGIAGIRGEPGANASAAVEAMTAALVHRGPDDSGVWVDAAAGVALGHRRLSILDLSSAGHQPMSSHCSRYVIAFNGEIYNHADVRKELEAADPTIRWRGHSDTETILTAVARWGVVPALKRMAGMFAFALWDREKRVLHLVRDRLGEKPLYYGWLGRTLVFASELKALRVHPQWRGEIDRGALVLLLRHNYIPAPHSIYQGIRKLMPGTILSVRADGSCEEVHYWSARETAERGASEPFAGSEAEAAEALERLLSRSVGRQMVADVPLGAFLSGGVDSSTIVALMQAQSPRPVKTFTIGFNEEAYNEAEHAKAVARHLGTDHTELYVTPQEAMDVIPRLPELFDEPFADSSQIPTFLVSRLARQHVKVSLSGDGGDELFGGYNRYFWGRSIWRKIGWMPRGLRGLIAGGLRTLPPQSWDLIFQRCAAVLPGKLRQRSPGDKLHKLAGILAVDSPEAMYLGLVSHWKDPATVVLGASEPTVLTDRNRWANLEDFTQRMMYLDTVSYLPDDILVKVDRASMGVSLESRVPFLDHRVVECSWKLPLSMKIRGVHGKSLLRQVLYK
ncbi:MAG: asparagine synthase (glutamine-hydrolyzing), partial [Gammaproteobacteria bacterium]|nr:asparagine synthase (glutamine-hydrolyzing) [Gammaproteobacteria bacterium]